MVLLGPKVTRSAGPPSTGLIQTLTVPSERVLKAIRSPAGDSESELMSAEDRSVQSGSMGLLLPSRSILTGRLCPTLVPVAYTSVPEREIAN